MFTAEKERRSFEDNPARGRWRPFHKSAILCCPQCGFLISLIGTHDIADSGEVTPNVRCPAYKCRFTGPVLLLGFDSKRDEGCPASAFADLSDE